MKSSFAMCEDLSITSTTKSHGVLLDRRSLHVLLLLSAVIWTAHFLFSKNFGLYEDDYSHVSPWMAADLSTLMPTLTSNFVSWPQGRPLHFSFPKVFGLIGFQAAGLQGIYVVGAGILTLNAFLFYCLLKRLGPGLFALLGGVAFCLFPADTTRPFLTHAVGYQPSLTFLLIATHLYMSHLVKSSYLAILGALLTFEAGLAAFVVAPLLKRRWDRELVKELMLHFAVLAILAATAFLIRTTMGDHRVLDLAGTESSLLLKIVAGLFIGTVVSMAQWLLGPLRVFINLDLSLMITIVIAFVAFLFVFSSPAVQARVEQMCALPSGTKWARSPRSILVAAFMQTAPVGAAGLAWILTSYGLAFTHFPPVAQFGRGTSVHLAASLGASLLIAWFFSTILSLSADYRVKKLVTAVIAFYFALLSGYGVLIQRDYQSSWKNQKQFWNQVINLTPDASDGTLIFVVKEGLPETRYILTHSWADPIILEQIYRFPTSWNQVPRLFVVEKDWNETIVIEGRRLQWRMPKAHWPVRWHELPDGNVILLRMNGSRLARSFGTIDIRGRTLNLKAFDASPSLDKGVLFNLLVTNRSVIESTLQ